MSDEQRDRDTDGESGLPARGAVPLGDAPDDAARQREQDTPPAGFEPVRPETPEVPAPPDTGPVQVAPERAPAEEGASAGDPPADLAAAPAAGAGPALVGGPVPVEPGTVPELSDEAASPPPAAEHSFPSPSVGEPPAPELGAGGAPLGGVEPAPGGDGVMSRPEVIVGAAFVGGFLLAMILRRLGS